GAPGARRSRATRRPEASRASGATMNERATPRIEAPLERGAAAKGASPGEEARDFERGAAERGGAPTPGERPLVEPAPRGVASERCHDERASDAEDRGAPGARRSRQGSEPGGGSARLRARR